MLVLLLSSCSRLGLRRRWRWWTLAGVGLATALASGCGGSNPDPDLLVLPPSSVEALAPSAAISTAVANPAPEPPGPARLAPAALASPPADLASAPPAVEVPVILKPELDPVPTTGPAPLPEPELLPEPVPVSLAEVGAVPEPAEAVVTDTPDDHGHEHPEPNPAPEPGPAPPPLASLLPPPVGELILLAENTEETFIDGSGWVEARYQPIEVEIGAQLSVPDGDGSTVVTRMVDLEHNGLWDIYECDVHEAYGGPPGTGWEFAGYAYRDPDGRFRLVVGSARPVGPCGP